MKNNSELLINTRTNPDAHEDYVSIGTDGSVTDWQFPFLVNEAPN